MSRQSVSSFPFSLLSCPPSPSFGFPFLSLLFFSPPQKRCNLWFRFISSPRIDCPRPTSSFVILRFVLQSRPSFPFPPPCHFENYERWPFFLWSLRFCSRFPGLYRFPCCSASRWPYVGTFPPYPPLRIFWTSFISYLPLSPPPRSKGIDFLLGDR